MRTRRLAVALTALALLVAGFTMLRSEATPTQRLLAADLDRLRGDDGLYLGGLTDRPGLLESAYGLTVLAIAGRTVHPAVSATTFAAQLPADPLWNRRYLAQLEKVTHRRLHTGADVSALLAMRTPQGYITDPAAPERQAAAPGYRLAATDAALEALAAFGVPLTGPAWRRTVDWLRTAGAKAARSSLTQRLHLLRADTLLGQAAPEEVRAAIQATPAPTGGAVRGDALIEICSYVELAGALGVDLSSRRAALRAALDPEHPPTDPQEAAMLAAAWSALHGAPDALETLRRLVERHQLSSGLVSSIQNRLGDLQASQQVEELRALAGLPTRDPTLAAAVRAHRRDLDRSSTGAAAAWLAVLAAAGDARGAADSELRRRAMAEVPHTLSADDVQAWAPMVRALTALRLPVPPVSVTPWPADTPEHRYKRYLAIAGLARLGRTSALPDPGSPDGIAAAGLALLSGSLHQAEAALTAANALGWRPSRAERDQARTLLARLRGCPGTPALFRDGPDATACDVYATTAAWRIHRLLGGTP